MVMAANRCGATSRRTAAIQGHVLSPCVPLSVCFNVCIASYEKSAKQTPTDGMAMLVPTAPSPTDRSGICIVKLKPVSKTQPSRESLEQVVDGDFREQLWLSVPLYEPGKWQYQFQISSFTTTTLNLLFAEAERKGKTRNFRMYIGPGSDGSSADKLSLDLKFNPWDTATTFRPEWRSMNKTVFTPCDPLESWYTEHNDVWLDDVTTFHHRPMRCVIAFHPFFLAQENTAL